MHLSILSNIIFLSSLTLTRTADAMPTAENTSYLTTDSEFLFWLSTTDAEITYIGEPINPLTPRAASNTRVTFCNRRIQNVCGGTCTVYNGGATCLNAPGTQCLSASHNVGFCDRAACNNNCHQLSTCGTRLDAGFCATPGTASILVGAQ